MTSPSTTDPKISPSGLSGFPHYPALDGVRGIAVAAVLVFHGDFAIASGGFLGVSTFFTLSGFLITSLLLTERSRSGTIALRAFWARRFKRLLPAAVATIAAIGVVWHWLDLQTESDFSEVDVMARLPGDLWASLLYVFNWRAAFPPEGAGYNDLFGEVVEPSPAAHFWSLSIEEQFYVFFPFLAFIILAKIGSRHVFGWVLAGLLVLSIASVTWLDGFDRIYNGTDVRMAEILVGALLALAFSNARGRAFITENVGLRWAGPVILAITVVLWSITELTTDWLLQGGLAIYAVGTAVIICAATQERGPVRALLGWGPLVWLGAVSYGVYLYHWPIFRFVDEDLTGLDPVPLFAVRMAFTLALAWLSFHYLENPIRRNERPGAKVRYGWAAAGLSLAFLGGLAVVYAGRDEAPEVVFEDPATPAITPATSTPSSSVNPDTSAPSTSSAPPTTIPSITAPFAEPPTLFVVGDSIALNLQNGLDRRAEALGEPETEGVTFGGCGIARGGEILWPEDDIRPACRTDFELIYDELAKVGSEVVFLVGGPVDMLPRRFADDEPFGVPSEAAFIERVRVDYQELQDNLVAENVAVVWTTVPCIQPEKADELGLDPTAVEGFNTMIRSVAADTDGRVAVYDLHETVCDDGAFVSELYGDPNAREDGLHFSESVASELAKELAAVARTLGPLPQ
ncbi:MAG: acyltransferase family protein [Acidimicrobiales bacterium]